MPHYMVQFAYSNPTWLALLQKPEDRTEALDALAKQFGGRLVALYYHFGDFDGTAIFDAPDDTSVNAAVMAVQASGSVRATRTTRLFSAKELVDALGRAGKIAYHPPAKK